MEAFLNEHELHEFILTVSTWEGRLHVLDLLAKREARLMNNSVPVHASIVDAPLDFDKTELYEECRLILANMATKLTSHHNAHIGECASIVLRCAAKLNTLPEFPTLYARFTLADKKLEKALTKPEERKLAGYCVHCNKPLFTSESRKEQDCSYCGTVNDIATVRAELQNSRSYLLREKTVRGTLKQITNMVNMVNRSAYSFYQVRRFLKSGKILGEKINSTEWIVAAKTLHLD